MCSHYYFSRPPRKHTECSEQTQPAINFLLSSHEQITTQEKLPRERGEKFLSQIFKSEKGYTVHLSPFSPFPFSTLSLVYGIFCIYAFPLLRAVEPEKKVHNILGVTVQTAEEREDFYGVK